MFTGITANRPDDPEKADPPFDDPLVFGFEAEELLPHRRPHWSENRRVLSGDLRKLRQYYNLPFDIVALKPRR